MSDEEMNSERARVENDGGAGNNDRGASSWLPPPGCGEREPGKHSGRDCKTEQERVRIGHDHEWLELVGGELDFMAVRVEEVDGLGNLMMLLCELYASPSQELLPLLEVGRRDSEGEVPHGDRVATGAGFRVVADDWEERDRCRADTNHGWEVAPDVLVEALQTKDLLVPLCRRSHVAHQDGDVIESLCDEHLRRSVTGPPNGAWCYVTPAAPRGAC